MSITVPRSPIHMNNAAIAPNCGGRTAATSSLGVSLWALLDLLALFRKIRFSFAFSAQPPPFFLPLPTKESQNEPEPSCGQPAPASRRPDRDKRSFPSLPIQRGVPAGLAPRNPGEHTIPSRGLRGRSR